ncbi:MAG: oxidoreductase [Planctomyces sp.]|nr:oxidoreductase [Planctomyces sp.]
MHQRSSRQSKPLSRRDLLKLSAGMFASSMLSSHPRAGRAASPNDRPRFGLIGTGWRSDIRRTGRGVPIGRQAKEYGNLVALCDVDGVALEWAKDQLGDGKSEQYHDYQEILAREDVEAVLIATPDHWHTKIAIEAMRAGKDVYCEKPLTLTIGEGQQIAQVVRETNRVFQVGTQQRSENSLRFLTAVALVQSGRLGKITRVSVGIDEGLDGGPFPVVKPPGYFDWDRWLGPAPQTPYIKERSHWTFRWWYEYSGGKLTDWGAHHVDIAQWAIGMQETGPLSVNGTATFPQELHRGFATRPDMYNMPIKFELTCQFPNDISMVIHSRDNGILFEGTEGRIFVNRAKLTGTPVEELKVNPLPEETIVNLYKGKQPTSHMANFFECMVSRDEPQSDVFTHHRTLSTCHLANISLRLGRELKWDPEREQILNDDEANSFLAREPREGYKINAS